MTFAPQHPVVWTEIPVTDLAAGRRFYESVFQWAMAPQSGPPNDFVFFTPPSADEGIGGHIYPGTPAQDGGPTIHLQVPGTLEDAVDRVWNAGGKVLDMPPVTIPAGRFVYALDPDGNSIGLFEPKQGG
ncbi:VOC family protein [Jannaschia aquimarina]|uniref:Glyoxalase-like domain protein n=1 Tax=Jannaschia aquimarina TaxID=935700 RepID=A0A0D1CQG8_9RHOB|nr:VOC family protein [Jannaschia aquimarina]KIT17032.1 Glyoxalase-like domain protein [Jannaschia aquimarina]SNS81890.1 hypothetical protein SAMN05421775_102425 [Jannaschia aquimarina]